MSRHAGLILVVFQFATSIPVLADEVRLKSGGKGELTVSLLSAGLGEGRGTFGNWVSLNVALAESSASASGADARSVCLLFGQKTYSEFQSNREFRKHAEDLIGLESPLTAVRVSFERNSTGSAILYQTYNFDMQGIVKCRRFESK